MTKVNIHHSIAILVTIFFISLHVQTSFTNQSVSYETIGNLRFKALGLEATNDQERIETKDIKKALSVSISENQKREMTYRLCAQAEHMNGIDATQDDENLVNLLRDLEVYGPVLDQINYTHTYRGEAFLAKTLASPQTNKKILRSHQRLTQKIAYDPVLLKKLDALLTRLKKSESYLLSFWQDETKIGKQLIDALYFNKKLPAIFHKNTALLELGSCLKHAETVFTIGGDIIVGTITFYLCNKLLHSYIPELPAISLKDSFWNIINLFTPFDDINHFIKIDDRAHQMQRSLLARQAAANNKNLTIAGCETSLRNGQSLALKLTIPLKTLMLGMRVYATKQAIDNELQIKNTFNYLQERLIGVSNYIRALKELGTLAKEYPELAAGLKHLKKGLALFENQSDDLHTLVKLLMSNTFTGKASFFSHGGRILAAYSLMQTEKSKLFNAFNIIGEIDSCVSSAHLYLANHKQHATYCFANYSEQEEPYIHAKGLWHPLVDKTVVVTNNIELGKPCIAHHMILTGSNKGGKSTLIKSIMIGELFALTLTIVPSKKFTTTPFDYLATYFNITDNTAEGKSLFMAQVERAKMIVQASDSLRMGMRALIIIDEMLTGTGVEKAADAAYKVAEHLASSPYICFILATHFSDILPKLEQATEGRCKNYKFDAYKDEQGKNVFNYKLEEGISQNNIANDILNEELFGIDFNN